MKNIIVLFVLAFTLSCAANAGVSQNDRGNAALAEVRIRIVDQDGIAVPNARIWGGFTTGASINDYALVNGFTDTNGVYVAQNKCNEFLRFDVRKQGYYRTEEKIFFGRSGAKPIIANGKWQPYGETRTVVLKKIKDPGVLKVPSSLIQVEVAVPVYGEWLPFDLEKFDWVKPHGEGSHDDVLLRFRRRITDKWYDFKYEMDVSFTNHPFAGAVVLAKDCNSEFTTEYNADTNAAYKASFNYFLERTKKSGSKSSVLDRDSYLVFRTRTTVDEEGRLKTAHYGAIHGEWMPGKTNMTFADGCFNPTPNDTNIEDGHQLRELLRQAK